MRFTLALAVRDICWAAMMAMAAFATPEAETSTIIDSSYSNVAPSCTVHRWSEHAAESLRRLSRSRSCCNVTAAVVSAHHHARRSCFDECIYHRGDRSWPPSSLLADSRGSHCLTAWHTIRSPSLPAPKVHKANNRRHGKGVRCGFGDVVRYDFEGSPTVEHVTEWLLQLECRFYLARLFPGSMAALLHSFRACNATVVVFNGGSGNTDIAMAVTQVLHRWYPRLCGLAVEADSQQEAKTLGEFCGITSHPAVTLLRRYRGTTEVVTMPSDSLSSVELLNLKAWLLLQPLWLLSRDDFAARVLAVDHGYVPTLVAFYSPWCENASRFLDAFARTAEHASDISMDGLRFATIDISEHHTAVLLLPKFSLARCLFVMLFYLRVDGHRAPEVAYWELNTDLPTPVQVISSLSTNADFVRSTNFVAATYVTWGVTGDELSRLTEGPFGTQCFVTSSNLTESDPQSAACADLKQCRGKRVPPGACRCTSDRFSEDHSYESSEDMNWSQQLETYYGLKIATSDYWRKILSQSLTTGLDVAVQRTVLGLYVRKSCASCESNMPTFAELAAMARQAGVPVHMYVINCSRSADLCNQPLVNGYPSLVAYRPFDSAHATAAAGCLSSTVIAQLAQGRMKYHGSLTIPELMRWLAVASAEAVKFLESYAQLPTAQEEEEGDELSLTATVMPRRERYLPQSRQLGWSHFFPLRCFRLACEVLFGPVKCYAVPSPAVPTSAFEDGSRSDASGSSSIKGYDGELVVTKVELRRSDGFNRSVVEMHRPLIEVIKSEEEEAAAAALPAASDWQIAPGSLHSTHRYGIDSTITCEANHSQCVDFILQFTRDHGRLPVTHMSPEMFHLPSGLIGRDDLPVLVTLMHPDNFTTGSKFSQMLQHVATSLYASIRVVTVDIAVYPAWVAQFAPLNGSLDYRHDALSPLYRYPRFCLVRWSDHSKAAFYPPLSSSVSEHDSYLSRRGLMDFAQSFLANPEPMLVATSRF